MNILILEDSPLRCEWFKIKFKGEPKVDFVDDPQKAIGLLEKYRYDRIYLDHDLLPDHYGGDTDCDKTTGLCVAKWLSENKTVNKEATITLHSRNPNGRARMKKVLNEGYRFVYEQPFDEMSGLSI